MATPKFVTFTGIDERTDLKRVSALSSSYPIEWGILFSPKRQGVDPRYPSMMTIGRIIDALGGEHDLAAHLCGDLARMVMDGENLHVAFPNLRGFKRAQVNHASPSGAVIAEQFSTYFPDIDPITQHRTLEFPDFDGISWLYDCSGGRGKSPEAWPSHPGGNRMVGYAGGLNPDNVAEQNSVIASTGDYWLDMEGGIRTDDWLDLDKCEQVCNALFG